MKKLLISALFAGVSCFSAFSEEGILGIRADKSKQSFTLSDVAGIKVNGGDFASLSVNKTDGTIIDGFQTVVFNYELAGVKDKSAALTIQTYPNPVENIIYVSGLENDANIKVFDVDGKTVKQVIGKQIEVSDLAKGMYLLSVDGRMLKFIKK